MQISPKTPSIFQNLFVDKKKEPVNNLFLFRQHLVQKAKVKHIKLSIERPTTEQNFYTIESKYSHHSSSKRKSSVINDSQLTVVSVRKAQTTLNTIELSPQVQNRTITTPPRKQRQLHQILNHSPPDTKQQSNNKNLNYKFKVYSQEFRNKNPYVMERRRFEQSLDEKMVAQLEMKQKILQQKVEQYKMDLKHIDKKDLLPMSEVIERKLKQRSKQKRLHHLITNS